METHKLIFKFPDEKYANWLCAELEWELIEPKSYEESGPIIAEIIYFPPLPTLRSNEYIPAACDSVYGPFGHVNWTKISNQFQVVVPASVHDISLSMTLIDPNDQTIMKKVQLQRILKMNEERGKSVTTHLRR
jgi:hypothetical protein